MSFDTNPYTPAEIPSMVAAGEGPKVLDTKSKIICILFIIFGAIGTLGLLLNLVLFPLILIFVDTDFGDPQINDMVKQTAAGLNPVLMGVAIVSGIASVVMMIGGIGGLKQKLWGAEWIRKTALFYLGYKLVETAVGLYSQYQQLETTKVRMREQMKNNPDIDIDSIASIGFIVGVVITIGIMLAIMAFYLWTFLHMSKKDTLARFS